MYLYMSAAYHTPKHLPGVLGVYQCTVYAMHIAISLHILCMLNMLSGGSLYIRMPVIIGMSIEFVAQMLAWKQSLVIGV